MLCNEPITANAGASEEDEIEVTPEMVEAGVDALKSRYLELDDPANLESLCRDVIRAALTARR